MADQLKGNILIIDDSLTNLKLLSMTLGKAGYQVFTVRDGESGIEQASQLNPDVILLDVLMEGIDGFETCRRLKAQDATRTIPVIFMTVLSEPIDRLKGFEVGGVDYIVKPLYHEEVLARVNAHLTIRQQHRQLQEQALRLQDLNTNKDKFFSIICQDLQNPMEGLLHFAEFISQNIQQCSPEELDEIISTLRNSVGNLYELLKNLFTWASIQRDKLDYYPQYTDVHDIIGRNIALLMPMAEQKQIVLKNLIQEHLSAYADASMVYAVVRNVLSNALKFTDPGGKITIDAVKEDDFLKVSVTDTGIGIQQEDVARLFRIDTKCQRTGTAGEEGTGLGLILSKELVEKNGGMLMIASEVGKGTTVVFTLPTTQPE